MQLSIISNNLYPILMLENTWNHIQRHLTLFPEDSYIELESEICICSYKFQLCHTTLHSYEWNVLVW